MLEGFVVCGGLGMYRKINNEKKAKIFVKRLVYLLTFTYLYYM
jgi:hypothetical protein